MLGVTGMLGHALMTEFDRVAGLDVYGAARDIGRLSGRLSEHLLGRVAILDALNQVTVGRVLDGVRPAVVVNCIGVIKQDPAVADAVYTIEVNSLFPHLLAQHCARRSIRLVHISTDCVFSGVSGGYLEADNPDPPDLYGRSKLLGEVVTAPAITLRTSVIGHELRGGRSLLDWFLRQQGTVKGYTGAIYTGFTTVELAHLLSSVVLPRDDLVGLFHVASSPISKYELLRLIAAEYHWTGELVPYDGVSCDRSLSPAAFVAATSYQAPTWRAMITELHGRGATPAGSDH